MGLGLGLGLGLRLGLRLGLWLGSAEAGVVPPSVPTPGTEARARSLVSSGASGTFFIVVNQFSRRRIRAGLPEGEHGALKKSQIWPRRTSGGRPSWMILSWKLAGRSR